MDEGAKRDMSTSSGRSTETKSGRKRKTGARAKASKRTPRGARARRTSGGDVSPELTAKGIEFVVVSGDMIEGTVTATLLDRLNPGAIDARKEAVGKLYNVEEFAAEIVKAAEAPAPANNTVLVGDTGYFTK